MLKIFKKVSALTHVQYKSVRYIEVFPGEFDQYLVGSLKKCPPLPGVRYVAFPLNTGLNVFQTLMKGPSNIKFMTILTEFCRNSNEHLGKNTVLSTVSLIWLEKNPKKQAIGNNVLATVITDLSKTFDCINHDFLIAKLNTCSFDSPPLKFMSGYLNFRKQKTKVGSVFSDYLNILFGARQGSIALPLFLNR